MQWCTRIISMSRARAIHTHTHTHIYIYIYIPLKHTNIHSHILWLYYSQLPRSRPSPPSTRSTVSTTAWGIISLWTLMVLPCQTCKWSSMPTYHKKSDRRHTEQIKSPTESKSAGIKVYTVWDFLLVILVVSTIGWEKGSKLYALYFHYKSLHIPETIVKLSFCFVSYFKYFFSLQRLLCKSH